MVFDLLNAGLLQDENGKLSNRMRVKALELLGFGVWENAQDINEIHTKRASKENAMLLEGKMPEPTELDNHEIHISEHIAFILSGDYSEKQQKSMIEHIRMHKAMLRVKED